MKLDLTEDEIKQLADSQRSLLYNLIKIGVNITDTESLYKDQLIIYKITVPEKSFQYINPEENAKAAKQILIDNASEFGIEEESIKVMYNIRSNEVWTQESVDKMEKIYDEMKDEI